MIDARLLLHHQSSISAKQTTKVYTHLSFSSIPETYDDDLTTLLLIMKELDLLLKNLKSAPETVSFQEVMNIIEKHYNYTPTRFRNGTLTDNVINDAGENEGSCKIFSFAKIQNLTEEQTLHCFGQYYRDDVLNNPDKKDHANIRNFMKHGWDNIAFDRCALELKDEI